jgi:hypothetical protein
MEMSLAQVVYKISNDSDFAAQWHRDPEAALSGNGFNLTSEEFDFLSQGLRRVAGEAGLKVNLADLLVKARGWRD